MRGFQMMGAAGSEPATLEPTRDVVRSPRMSADVGSGFGLLPNHQRTGYLRATEADRERDSRRGGAEQQVREARLLTWCGCRLGRQPPWHDLAFGDGDESDKWGC
jgi:hypothetical protein